MGFNLKSEELPALPIYESFGRIRESEVKLQTEHSDKVIFRGITNPHPDARLVMKQFPVQLRQVLRLAYFYKWQHLLVAFFTCYDILNDNSQPLLPQGIVLQSHKMIRVNMVHHNLSQQVIVINYG